ncbi:hypothetical protein BT63DRAFT_459626 [Microthyrium microscopicum]|uniref:Uncharacterized protein n=1 Tax=Microthyrium microscopicum TaxID=703497 RepID=A0A6A6U1K7_9PEZI|nr:hypothetical protein BT63DRAFT_459626 [Microthyrium microscopicum]
MQQPHSPNFDNFITRSALRAPITLSEHLHTHTALSAHIYALMGTIFTLLWAPYLHALMGTIFTLLWAPYLHALMGTIFTRSYGHHIYTLLWAPYLNALMGTWGFALDTFQFYVKNLLLTSLPCDSTYPQSPDMTNPSQTKKRKAIAISQDDSGTKRRVVVKDPLPAPSTPSGDTTSANGPKNSSMSTMSGLATESVNRRLRIASMGEEWVLIEESHRQTHEGQAKSCAHEPEEPAGTANVDPTISESPTTMFEAGERDKIVDTNPFMTNTSRSHFFITQRTKYP